MVVKLQVYSIRILNWFFHTNPQVVSSKLCVNFINDQEDDSEYCSEYGSAKGSNHFTRNAFNTLIVDDNNAI